jgi:hypothetical protein
MEKERTVKIDAEAAQKGVAFYTRHSFWRANC